jgi:catalase (peroxidase I)
MSFVRIVVGSAAGVGVSIYACNQFQAPKREFTQIKDEINNILWQKDYEDKHLGPLFVRLAWHASGTYDAKSNTGGSNGATMRFPLESKDGANAGLNEARDFLEPIKQKHPNVSYADLWIYASYVSIETMGGPSIPFSYGRKDSVSEADCPPNGRLPDAAQGRKHIRDVFGRMGFNDQEMVALIGGGHSLGRCHTTRSGFSGPWNFNPLAFTNLYFKELLNKEWVEKKWSGPRQFEDKLTGKLMMLPTDMEFRDDPEFRKWSEKYRDSEELLVNDFSGVFKKLTEFGCKNLVNI